jgi:hypothetical protein
LTATKTVGDRKTGSISVEVSHNTNVGSHSNLAEAHEFFLGITCVIACLTAWSTWRGRESKWVIVLGCAASLVFIVAATFMAMH